MAAEVRAFIERQRVAHLATAGPDGTPHLVPICFALADGVVYSTVDDKPKRTQQLRRVQNIAERPQVALLFDHYEEDWGRLGWVQLRGRASLLERGEEHAHALAALRERYAQYRGLNAGERAVIRVEPAVVRCWGALAGP
ncbi:MAG: TIGR03668 family PPOX class F420-dependent oxidoreductase, partial [Chloroflexi bacterium]|nr:TIGR03668 family PPOX class F420-dependent oxidoreductase [Chloroflexota bacterium]